MSATDTLMLHQIEHSGWIAVDSLLEFIPTPHLQTEPIPLIPNGNNSYTSILYLYNNSPDSSRLFLQIPPNEFWELAQVTEVGDSSVSYAGVLEAHSRWFEQDNAYVIGATLPPHSRVKWSINCRNLSTRAVNLNNLYLYSESEYFRSHHYAMQRHLLPTGISLFFQGAIWMMMLYMFFLYFQNNRDTTYLYYGLYMFCAMYYLLQKVAGNGPFFFVLGEKPIVQHLLNEPVQWLIYFFYNMFILRFLEIKKYSRLLHRMLLGISIAYLVYMVAEGSWFILTFDKLTQSYLFIFSRSLVLIFALYTIIHGILVIKSPLLKYIIVGSIMFTGFTMISMFYSLGFSWLPDSRLYPINFMQIGILLEIFFFSLGMGRRIHLISIEKETVQKAYIDQLVRNEEIIQKSNQQLSAEVFKRTNEIIYKSRELEREREEKLKSEYQKQLMESEMNTLRLQMNPHFIFNSLNSIRYYILKEDTEKAADYITSFSRLLRMILQHSKQSTIKLSEELEALRLYIEFERQRFENKFDFSIRKVGDVDVENIRIQPLIIQPFVENSIWHGLLHKEGTGHLLIELEVQGDVLQIVVEDDGVGRKQSKEYETDKGGTYKSMGMQITKDRLKVMAQMQMSSSGYEVIDLVNADGSAAGTRVILKIRIS